MFAAQAWHWTDPATRYHKAHAVLQPGGGFALLTNEKGPYEPGLRDEFNAAYAKWFGWPSWEQEYVAKVTESWSSEIAASGLFHDVTVTYVPWTQAYTAEQYIALIDTYSDHAVRPEEQRAGCYSEIKAAIERRGGSIAIPYITLAFFALRSD